MISSTNARYVTVPIGRMHDAAQWQLNARDQAGERRTIGDVVVDDGDNGAATLHRRDRLQRRRSGRPPSQQQEVARAAVDQVLGHSQPDARQPAGDEIRAVGAAD